MRTIAVVTAALAISFACAGTASADSVTITRNGVDAFGNNQRFTQSIDNFGNRRSVVQKDFDNGFVHCRTMTLRSTDAWGDSASRTMRRCAPDF
jgi:hypothetical protein